ncbi:MAG: helix-turn-helix domain-containing protein [Clostridia bacterium]|nr:helix-turn-helix domain-containing protein [Clostridia bacterium]
MKSRNICKFVTDTTQDNLEMHQFIYESDPAAMANAFNLTHHRAILVKQGNGTFKFDNTEVVFSPGCLIFGFENEHFEVNAISCEYMYISFSGTRSDFLFRRFGINRTNRCFSGFDGIIPLWHDSLSRASDENIDLASESILLYTFSRLSGVSAEQNKLVNQIIEISEERFSNPDLSVISIAKELAYNPKYLSHFFKKNMGISYSEYLRTLRIKYAVSLFDHGIDSVKNVAFLSGFSDPLYFSTVFKKTVGKSPKEYMGK